MTLAASFEPDRFWHPTLSAVGRCVLYPTEADIRRAVLALGRIAARDLIAFNLVDNHNHLQTGEGRRHAGRVSRALQRGLAPLVAAPLAPTHFEPIRDQAHNASCVRYVLRQAARHDLPVHPALWSGSAFLDLIGARWIAGLELQLRKWLPRFRMRSVFAGLRLPERPIPQLPDEQLRQLGAARIMSAAAAAACTDPDLRGRGQVVLDAKRAGARLARSLGVKTDELVAATGLPGSTVRRLAMAKVEPRLVSAVRCRLELEQLVAESHRLGPSRPSHPSPNGATGRW